MLIIEGLGLLCGVQVLVLFLGLLIWRQLLKRIPGTLELLSYCFGLGYMALTVIGAVAITGGNATGLAFGLFLFALLVWKEPDLPGLLRAGRSVPGRWRLGRFGIVLALLFGSLAVGELLLCTAPTTAWDAFTYHYGLVELFKETHSLAGSGRSIYELHHLNCEVLSFVWFQLQGETLANVFSLAQTISLAALVYLEAGRFQSGRVAACIALCLLSLPLIVHQSCGGWNDTLLVESALIAFFCVERMSQSQPSASGWAVLGGLAAGYAWGVKQSAPVLLLPTYCLLIFLCYRGKILAKHFLVYGTAMICLAAPWILRTCQLTGNPLYPALPMLTKLPNVTDYSSFTGRRGPLPLGPALMVLQQSTVEPLETAFTPSTGLLCLLFLLLGTRSESDLMRRGRLAVCIANFLLAYIFFPGTARYALYTYVFLLVTAASFRNRLTRPVIFSTAVLTLTSWSVAMAVVGVKLYNRREFYLGRDSARDFVHSKYPSLALLDESRGQLRPDKALLVFNGLTYHNGLPTYDADPWKTAPKVSSWVTSSEQAVLENLAGLKVQYILISFDLPLLKHSLRAWAIGRSGGRQISDEDFQAVVQRSFPEWRLDATVFSCQGQSSAVSGIWDQLLTLRPRLRHIASNNRAALYEIVGYPPLR